MKARRITLKVHRDCLIAALCPEIIGFSPDSIWCPIPSRTHRTEPYPVPQAVAIATKATDQAACRFSPSPYSVAVLAGNRKCLIGVMAARGWHHFNTVEFAATRQWVNVKVDLEGHTPPAAALKHVHVFALPGDEGEPLLDLLARGMRFAYPSAFRKRRGSVPSWWHRPIYCGYGDQVAASVAMEGPGPEPRSLAYCTQGLYERWVGRLDRAGVPIGTIIIDAGWSQGGVWKPNPIQWPDMKAFIAQQHKRGRRVLVWVATWMCEGLSDSWCVRAGKHKLAADPTNPDYRRFLRKQVRELLSPDGLNADGFKIDQLAHVPNERDPRQVEHFGRTTPLQGRHPKLRALGAAWGCELLYQLQREIYQAAKAAKPDAMTTSSTVHPYFHDTLDVVRLHDTGCVDEHTDVFCAMQARAKLARAVLPHCLIDTDDWVHTIYEKWLEYTLESHRLGIPCTFYAERFVRSWKAEPTTVSIPMDDLRRIGRQWRRVLEL